jgi:hypothetical protein
LIPNLSTFGRGTSQEIVFFFNRSHEISSARSNEIKLNASLHVMNIAASSSLSLL